eukprot:TRINITY_DN9946_c0_g1_i1.p1 TRINITY_DN9946_c0_g1~~TRINITY_DN9946_c0_g1_i1.p1  ORF type:complete len:62 (+),score=4.35 TRINITY_DN9946_c0_g1_i1:40-225(+)
MQKKIYTFSTCSDFPPSLCVERRRSLNLIILQSSKTSSSITSSPSHYMQKSGLSVEIQLLI